MEGFDHLVSSGSIGGAITEKGWLWSQGSYTDVAVAAGRFGIGSSLYCQYNPGPGLAWTGLSRTVSNKQTLIVGYAINVTTYPWHTFTFYDSGTAQLIVKMDSSGKLYFTNGAGTILTDTISSNTKLKSGKWEFVEIKVTIADSISSDSCIVRINENVVCNLAAGQDTKNTANAYCTYVTWAGCGNNIDDFYLCDNSGSINNDFLGDCRVATLYPTGNGNYSQFVGSDSNSTDNYALVDDPTKNTTDFVTSNVLNAIDSYNFGNFTGSPTTVRGVQVDNYAAKTDVGTRKIKSLMRINSVDYLSNNETTISPTWTIYTDIIETDPSTSAAWQSTAIDSAEFGFKITY